MALVCTTCGARNTDPGGLPEDFVCGSCGNPTLVRVQPAPPDPTGKTVAGAAIGGTLGGLMFGAIGGVVGAVIGGVIGNRT